MSTEISPNGGEPGAASKLQILATEHWSMLATRSLTYTEGLNRVTIFLAILSGAVITLALVAQADHFGPTFIAIAIFLLAVVLFTGFATISRLNMLNRDDYRWVVGMNRLRHAYLEIHPELEPHFIASPYDDLHGTLQTLGIDDVAARQGFGVGVSPASDAARHADGDSGGRRWRHRSPRGARPRLSATGHGRGDCGGVRAGPCADACLGPEGRHYRLADPRATVPVARGAGSAGLAVRSRPRVPCPCGRESVVGLGQWREDHVRKRRTVGLRFDGASTSCSSLVTIVAKFGQCFSASIERKAAPGI